MTARALLPLLVLGLLGCGAPDTVPTPPPKPDPPKWKLYDQTCEMCGTEWTVQTRGNDIPPRTIEWCFHDGNFCAEGFDLFVGGDREAFVDHCKTCLGCRCAAFTPDQWRTVQKLGWEKTNEQVVESAPPRG